MKASEWFASLGAAEGIADVINAAKAEHGRHWSRALAQETGASQRTLRDWAAGKHAPGRKHAPAVDRAVSGLARQRAADRLRQITTVDAGSVAVDAGTDERLLPDGSRSVGKVNVGAIMDRVADAYARGDDAEAERLFDAAVIAVYGDEDPTDDSGLASILHITDYEDGIEAE